EMRAVTEIGARGHDPIAEACLDQGNERRHAGTRRCQSSGQAHADRHVVVEHVAGEKLTGLTQACAVVREEGAVDQVDERSARLDWPRIDSRSLQVTALPLHRSTPPGIVEANKTRAARTGCR